MSQSGETSVFGGVEKLILAAIAVVLGMQAYLAVAQEINWDEFFYLSKVYDYQAGTMTKSLQSFVVHFFGWLPLVGSNVVRQVEAARGVMLLFETGTAYCLYLIARRFVSRSASLLAVLAFVSAGTTIVHGASFRADPIAAFLMMASLTLLTRPVLKIYHLSLAAIAIALGGLITIKVALYAPALLAVGLWQYFKAERSVAKLAQFTGVAIGSAVIFGLLYIWHQSTLAVADVAGAAGSQNMITSAAKTTLLEFEFFPRLVYAIQEFPRAIVPALMLFGGLFLALSHATKPANDRINILAMLGLASPILCFLFYRNAYPYFFPFIFPPAMVLAGYAADQWKLNRSRMLILAGLMVASAAWTTWLSAGRDQQAQHETVGAIHKIFPQPVAYIDRNSMISSFPKRGLFMSRWGLKDYREAGVPVFDGILTKEVVPLLLLNSPALEHAVGDPITAELRTKLFDADQETLRTNYIRHWGKIWVAGKALTAGPNETEFQVLIPGSYELEAGTPVQIDGRTVMSGGTVMLSRGDHLITAETQQAVQLRWAAAKYRPSQEPSGKPIYRGFRI